MKASATARPAAAPPGISRRAGKYLIFSLGEEEFGAEVMKVREIMGLQNVTAIPQMPAHVKGVINLRGKVIPVIDLRLKFAMPAAKYTPRTCIIVMSTCHQDGERLVGMIVDGVDEVLNLTATEMEATLDFGPGVTTPYLTGIAKVKGRVKILLDVDKVLDDDQTGGWNGTVQ